MSVFTQDTATQMRLRQLGRRLNDLVRRYMADEEHRRDFERWYLETYGEEYQWKYGYPAGGGSQEATP